MSDLVVASLSTNAEDLDYLLLRVNMIPIINQLSLMFEI